MTSEEFDRIKAETLLSESDRRRKLVKQAMQSVNEVPSRVSIIEGGLPTLFILFGLFAPLIFGKSYLSANSQLISMLVWGAMGSVIVSGIARRRIDRRIDAIMKLLEVEKKKWEPLA